MYAGGGDPPHPPSSAALGLLFRHAAARGLLVRRPAAAFGQRIAARSVSPRLVFAAMAPAQRIPSGSANIHFSIKLAMVLSIYASVTALPMPAVTPAITSTHVKPISAA